ncbi:MAG TPA: matrixin family metalloprotease [Steroidobacteraceae bacterium]|nr:matrixin family metalloprotease [Steroidobacteraceae bacterium]
MQPVRTWRPVALVGAGLLAACGQAPQPVEVPAVGTLAPAPVRTCPHPGIATFRAAPPAAAPVVADDANGDVDTDTGLAALLDADAATALAARAAWRNRDVDDFVRGATRECGADGKYVVDGDVTIADVAHLRAFFDQHIRAAAPPPALPSTKLPPTKPPPPAPSTPSPPAPTRNQLVALTPGTDAVWPPALQHALTYCVGTAFRGQHDRVVADLEAATGAWELAADVDFRHVAEQDAHCDAANDAVTFDVNPVDLGLYLARGFSPDDARAARNLHIDIAALTLDPADALQLTGLLRHELGHVLGFRHENPRPQAGPCFDDSATPPIAATDALSVMHYPPCSGGRGWKFLLTDRDQSVVACVYGAARGFVIDPRVCRQRDAPQSRAGVFSAMPR